MMTVIYIVIGLVVLLVLFIIALRISQHFDGKKKQQYFKDYIKRHNLQPLTEEQKRLLSFGAVLCYGRSETILNMIPENMHEVRKGVHHQWQINDREEALEAFDRLLALNRSREFDQMLQSPNGEFLTIQKTIAKDLSLDLSVVQQTRSTYSWDTCRAVCLAKWCFWLNFITEEEAWDIMKQAAAKASAHGNSWTDYVVSYLMGRTIGGFNLDEISVEAGQLLHGKSPWITKVEDIDVYQRYAFK